MYNYYYVCDWNATHVKCVSCFVCLDANIAVRQFSLHITEYIGFVKQHLNVSMMHWKQFEIGKQFCSVYHYSIIYTVRLCTVLLWFNMPKLVQQWCSSYFAIYNPIMILTYFYHTNLLWQSSYPDKHSSNNLALKNIAMFISASYPVL